MAKPFGLLLEPNECRHLGLKRFVENSFGIVREILITFRGQDGGEVLSLRSYRVETAEVSSQFVGS